MRKLQFYVYPRQIFVVLLRVASIQHKRKYHSPQNNATRRTQLLRDSIFSRRILYVRKERSSGIVAAGLVAKIVTGDSKRGRATDENCCIVIVLGRETNIHPASSRIFSITSGPAIISCGRKRYV